MFFITNSIETIVSLHFTLVVMCYMGGFTNGYHDLNVWMMVNFIVIVIKVESFSPFYHYNFFGYIGQP